MNYLLYYTQYMQICQMTCFCYCISKTKDEFGQNPEENIILPGQYTKILTGQYIQINTWVFPYRPGYHPEIQYASSDDNQPNMEMPMY
jgi:hypothetical protein